MLAHQKLTIVCLSLSLNVFRQGDSFLNDNRCGRTLYKKSGTFWSPSYYNSTEIKDPIYCSWRISAVEDEKITLNITNIDIEKTSNCTASYIEVRDGYWYNSPLIARLCGVDNEPQILSSTSNEMLVSYVHQNSNGYRGFRAYYEPFCGEDLFIDTNFTLKSHNSQQNYAPNKKCIWNVIVPEHHQIILKFKKFHLEHGDKCQYDYVEILDGSILNRTSLGRFCGSDLPPEIVSIFNNLVIKFVSDVSVQREGFVAEITTEYDECAAIEHVCAQNCINTIGTYRCSCKSGYELHSDGKNCEIACGGSFNFSSGVISSPSFPEPYPPNKNCTWEVLTPPGEIIVLNFTYFDLEGENVANKSKILCEKDTLQIFNKESKSLATHDNIYCGNVTPDPIISETNFMKITFMSDSIVQKTGFVLNYTTIMDQCFAFNGNCHDMCINSPDGSRRCICSYHYSLAENGLDCVKKPCHYKISSTSGNIYSPNDEIDEQMCSWRFKTTPGHRINLEFSFMELEQNWRNNGNVTLYDGFFSDSPQLASFSSSQRGATVTSSGDKMFMVFSKRGSHQRFQAKHVSVCGSVSDAITQKQYIFSHAQFGIRDYDSNTTCSWLILPPSEHNISLSIEFIQMEATSEKCLFDYLEIRDADQSFGRFCGTNKPSEEFISSSDISIVFHSDLNVNGKGFRIMYKAVKDDTEEEDTLNSSTSLPDIIQN